jgi:hypothetical protein
MGCGTITRSGWGPVKPSARVLCSALLAAGSIVAAGSARATSFVVDVATDPSLGTIVVDVDANNETGQVWRSLVIPITPITVNQGDDVTVNATFAGGLALLLQSGAFEFGLEEIDYTFTPAATGTTLSASSTLSVLTGVAGDLDAVLPITDSFTAIDQIGGTVTEDLTDTSFQYSGYTLQTTFTSLTGGPVTLTGIQLISAATQVAVVPEPTTGLLLAAGLAALARLRARR